MKIGLIGLANSGKTTIFNALTGMKADVASFSNRDAEPNIAIVDVLDPRVESLSEMYNPKKTIYANIEFTDFAGLSSGSAKEGAFTPHAMSVIKTTDALGLVVRNFNDETLNETLGSPDPEADILNISSELIIADLIAAEKRLEKIELDYTRGKKTPDLQKEERVLKIITEHLDKGKSIRSLDLDTEELKTISGFRFLSQKPFLVIINSGEENYGKNDNLLAGLQKSYSTIEFAGKFEMELSLLEEDDAKLFMEDIGITESARARLTTFAYQMLGYISFFTVGKDEVRAWTLKKGNNAVAAADTIHSDLARGFIRAECFTYDDLITHSNEKGVRENGRFRLEGKTYTVQDGDILNIRFSI